MGRGRGKGRKRTVRVTGKDHGNHEEGKAPALRRRGRPQKQLKDDTEEEAEKIEQDIEIISSKDMKNQTATDDGRKRKTLAHVKESIDSIKDDNAVEVKVGKEDTRKSVGFRQIGSRRKNKPRRAAEAGIECN